MEYANIELKTQEFFYSNGHVVLSSDKEKELEKLFSVCEKNLTYGEEVVFYTKKNRSGKLLYCKERGGILGLSRQVFCLWRGSKLLSGSRTSLQTGEVFFVEISDRRDEN